MRKYNILVIFLMIFLGAAAVIYSVRGYITNDEIQTGYLELTGEEGYYVDFDEDDIYDFIQLSITGEDKHQPEEMILLFNEWECDLLKLLREEIDIAELDTVYASELNWSDDFINLLVVFYDEHFEKHTAIFGIHGMELLLIEVLDGFPEENFAGDGYFQIFEKTDQEMESDGFLYLKHTFFIEEEVLTWQENISGYMKDEDEEAESCFFVPLPL